LECAGRSSIYDGVKNTDIDTYTKLFKEYVISRTNHSKKVSFYLFISKFPHNGEDLIEIIKSKTQKLTRLCDTIYAIKMEIAEDDTRFQRTTFNHLHQSFSDDQIALIPESGQDVTIHFDSPTDMLFSTIVMINWIDMEPVVVATNAINASVIIDSLDSINGNRQYVCTINELNQIARFSLVDTNFEDTIFDKRTSMKNHFIVKGKPIVLKIETYSVPLLTLIISAVNPGVFENRKKNILSEPELGAIGCKGYFDGHQGSVSLYTFPANTYPNHAWIHRKLLKEYNVCIEACNHLQQHKQQQ
jgi:hypothetical protein